MRLMIGILGRTLPHGSRLSQQTTYEGIKDFFTSCSAAEAFWEQEPGMGVKVSIEEERHERASEKTREKTSEKTSERSKAKITDASNGIVKEEDEEDDEQEAEKSEKSENVVGLIESFLLPRLPSSDTSPSQRGSGSRVFPISEKSEPEALRLSRANALLAYASYINPPPNDDDVNGAEDVTMSDSNPDSASLDSQRKQRFTAAIDTADFWISNERSSALRDILQQARRRLVHDRMDSQDK